VKKRVVVWGTGNVGRPAIRAVLSHRDLELVGVLVANPAKRGRDAGEIAGVAKTGVLASTDARALLAHGVDAVVYTASADTRLARRRRQRERREPDREQHPGGLRGEARRAHAARSAPDHGGEAAPGLASGASLACGSLRAALAVSRSASARSTSPGLSSRSEASSVCSTGS